MKKYLLLILVILVSACGGSKNGMVKITGKIENAIPQGEVILEKFETGQVRPVQTVYSDHKGNFEMEVDLDGPGFYRINIYNKQYETLILADENLKVEAGGTEGSEIIVTGSEDMRYLDEVYEYMDAYQLKVQDFNQRYIQARNEGNTALVEELTTEGLAMEAEKIDYLKKMAMSLEGSLVSLLITDFIPDKREEYKFNSTAGC